MPIWKDICKSVRTKHRSIYRKQPLQKNTAYKLNIYLVLVGIIKFTYVARSNISIIGKCKRKANMGVNIRKHIARKSRVKK